MAVRREKVILDLEDRFSQPMIRAAAAAGAFNKALGPSGRTIDTTSRSTDRLSSSMGDLNKEAGRVPGNLRGASSSVSSFGRDSDRTGGTLDTFTGRLSVMARVAATLGPALAPLGAAAVGGIAGLSTQLGFVAIAAGTTALAFSGVGDALSALDAAQLEPTAANLEKLRVAMDALGPAGRDFVHALDAMQPAISTLQDTAQAGMFPGLTEGLQSLLTLLPEVRGIISETAQALGDLGAEAGANLAGPKFEEFFTYLQTSARPILTELGQSFGNVFEGLANMMVAFDPLSRGFSSGLLDMSRSFAEWSRGLSESQGFQDFVSYIQESGPMALDALGSISNALVALVTAAAPVGQAILPAITGIADAFAALAGSPVGPTLVGAAAAMSALSTAVGGLRAVTGGGGGAGGFLGKALGVDAIKASVPTLGQVGTQLQFLGQSAERASAKTIAARESVRGFAKSLGPTAGLMAGLTVASTGLGEGLGISNTASLALMGSMAGVPGIVGGAVVGAFIDAAAANDSFAESLQRSRTIIQQQPGDFAAQAAAIDDTRQKYEDFANSVGKGDSDFLNAALESFKPSAMKNTWEGWWGDSDVDEMRNQLKDLEADAEAAQKAFAFSNVGTGVFDALGLGLTAVQDSLMDTIGAVDPVAAAFLAGASGADAFAMAVGRVNQTLSGRASFRDYEAAIDAASDSLKENGRTLDTNTEAGRANQAALDNIANSALRVAQNMKDVGSNPSGFLSRARKDFLAAAHDMGMTDARARALANSLGLVKSPAAIRLEAKDNASKKAEAVRRKAEGFAKDYQAALKAKDDGASSRAEAARKKGLAFARAYLAALKANDAASAKVRAAQALVNSFDGRSSTANIYVTTHRQTVFSAVNAGQSANPGGRADGGIQIAGRGLAFASGGMTDRGQYVPRVPQMRQGGGNILWSEPETGWEAYISGKPGMEDRNREIWRMAGDRLGVDFEEFAFGGITAYAKGGKKGITRKAANSARRQFDLDGDQSISELRAEFRELRTDFHLGRKAFIGLQRRAEAVSKAYANQEKVLDQRREKLRDLRSDKAEYTSTVKSAYTHDPFGNGAANLMTQLEADRNDAQKALALSKDLDKKGISQGLQKDLLASGDLTTLQQLAGMSKAEIDKYDKLYAQTQAATSGLGQYAGSDQYDKQIEAQSRLIARTERTLKRLDRLDERIERAAERGTRRGQGDRNRSTTRRVRAGA